ncbi:unnamed protein product [Trichobilharzia regenti]|nr:unnamed protein product [Trichobilharzia regenti]
MTALDENIVQLGDDTMTVAQTLYKATAKLSTLERERTSLMQLCKEEREQLEQCIGLRYFYRDAERSESWIGKQKVLSEIKVKIEQLGKTLSHLINAMGDKKKNLDQANRQQQFVRNVDVELWLSDVEAQIASEDVGRDLSGVMNTQRWHNLLESDVAAHRERIDAFKVPADTFPVEGHFDAPIIQENQRQLAQRYHDLHKGYTNVMSQYIGKGFAKMVKEDHVNGQVWHLPHRHGFALVIYCMVYLYRLQSILRPEARYFSSVSLLRTLKQPVVFRIMNFYVDISSPVHCLDVTDAFRSLNKSVKDYVFSCTQGSWVGCLIGLVQASPESAGVFLLIYQFRVTELLSVNSTFSNPETSLKASWEEVAPAIYSLSSYPLRLGFGTNEITTYYSASCNRSDAELIQSARFTDPKSEFLRNEDKQMYVEHAKSSFELQAGLHELLGYGSGKLFWRDCCGKRNFHTKTTEYITHGDPVKAENADDIGSWPQARYSTCHAILRVLIEADDSMVRTDEVVGEDDAPYLCIFFGRKRILTVTRSAIGEFIRK